MSASVSVIVPTFNRARWLGSAIRSALHQLQATARAPWSATTARAIGPAR